MWEQLETVVVDGLKLLVPALVAFALAWLQRRRMQLVIAKDAVVEVERTCWREAPPSGAAKKSRAVSLIQSETGAFTQMSACRAGELVEQVLPEVRATLPPGLGGSPPDRRSVEVDFPSRDGQ